jgi:RNA polymerase-binding transcription factor
VPPELRFGLAADGLCYPPRPMAATRSTKPAKLKSPFTKKELDDLRASLELEREQLQKQFATIEENSFATTQSDLTGEVAFDDETADAGTATFERERDLSIENNVRDLMQKIDRALEKMDAGTYGFCERCGKPIEKARVRALPYVDLCIKDAQAQSRR